MRKSKWMAVAMACALAAPVAAIASGAIAVDDKRGQSNPGYGFSLGKATRDEASRSAMRQCREHGNDDCKVVVRFDTCGAYAASNKYYGVGWGTSRHAAERMALEKCGRGSCGVVIAKCE